GPYHQLLRVGVERRGYVVLRDFRSVAVRRVEESVADVERAPQEPEHVGAILTPAPDVRARDAHRPESQAVHREIAEFDRSCCGGGLSGGAHRREGAGSTSYRRAEGRCRFAMSAKQYEVTRSTMVISSGMSVNRNRDDAAR